MWFLTAMSWLAFFVQICFVTLGLAAGLYYLAELVEEFTSAAGRCIRWITWLVFCINLGLLFVEEFPWHMPLLGLATQVLHLMLLNTFPVFYPLSFSFISTCIMFVVNHYLAFSYFGDHWYPFHEVLAYFTLYQWFVPMCFFVSLSANDQTLPVTTDTREHFDLGTTASPSDPDFVSNYLSGTKSKKYGLRVFLDYLKDSLFPSQKKRFS